MKRIKPWIKLGNICYDFNKKEQKQEDYERSRRDFYDKMYSECSKEDVE